jgi:hypothetical protein
MMWCKMQREGMVACKWLFILHLINVRADIFYTCYNSLWVEIGKFHGPDFLIVNHYFSPDIEVDILSNLLPLQKKNLQ